MLEVYFSAALGGKIAQASVGDREWSSGCASTGRGREDQRGRGQLAAVRSKVRCGMAREEGARRRWDAGRRGRRRAAVLGTRFSAKMFELRNQPTTTARGESAKMFCQKKKDSEHQSLKLRARHGRPPL